MFKKRLKGLLAMVLAGSIAATALPMSASATFGGTITIVGNGPDPIATIDPSDITSSGFSSGYLSEHPDYLNDYNMWAVASTVRQGLSSGSVFDTVSGDNLAGQLNVYKEESDTTYYDTYIKYSHKYVVTTDNPTTTIIDTNNAKTATTFPVNVSDPLASITGYTVWYGIPDDGSINSGNVVQAGATTNLSEPADSISIPMSTFEGLYSADIQYGPGWDNFYHGVTLIQVDTAAYKTFEIPVYDGWGELTTDKVSVTDGNTGDLIPDGKTEALKGSYKLVYDKDSSTQMVSGAFTNKADLWNAIKNVAVTYSEFDVSKAKLVRYVRYDAVIGYFTSVDLLNDVRDNQDINYLNERKTSGSIWRLYCSATGPTGTIYPNKFLYGDSFDAEIKEFLNEYDCDTVSLRDKTELHITATDPSTQVNPYGGFKLTDSGDNPQYITINTDKQYPVKVSDLATKLTAEISPTAGMKYNKDEWELWPCYTTTGNITMENKATVADPTEDIGITHYELALEQHRNDLLVYLKQVAIAPAVTVTAPAFNAVPATANIPANDGYSVKSVIWFDGTTELAEGDKFGANKQYTVKVTLTADTGLKFIESTPVTINGVTPTAKTLNQDGTLTVSYTFAATDKESLTAAEVTVTAPAPGADPVAAAVIPEGANYTASDVTWSPADAPFKGAKQYTATVKLTAKYGYKFTENTTAKVNGNAVTPVLNTDGTLSVSYTFAETDKEAVTAAEVTVTAPVLGAAPVAEAVIPEGANYTASAVTWSPADAPFKGAKQYTAAVVLTAKDGYKFTANTTAKLNGNAVTPVLNTDGTLSVSYTFAATEAEAVTAAEITVTAPEYGKAPAAAAVLPEGANYTASAVTWSPAAENFKSEQYTATVKLTAKDGYKFTANTTAKLNGNAVTPVLNADGTLTVSYTFDKLSAFPDANAELEKENPVIQVPKGEKITKELLQKIKESGKAVELDFGDYSWIIGPDFGDGELNDIDLSITKVPEENWATVVNNVTGHKYRMQISFAHSGEFGFTAYLVVDLTEGMVGAPDGTYYANLYQVLDDKLEWNASSVMTKDENDKWSAKLKFEHASEWLITIDDEDKNPANETPDTPDPTPSRPTVSGPSTDSGTKNPAKTTKSVGWPNITNEIKGSTVGATIEITLNDDTTIPEDALKAAAEKKVKLVIDAGYGRKWTIDGANANGGAVNLTVSGANVDIPESAYKNIPCTDSKQLKLNASALNFTAQLTVPVGKDSTGKNAGIFYYNEQTGKLVFQIVSVVDNDGNITFDVSRGGRYFIALGNEDYDPGILTGDANGDGVVNAQDASDILRNIVSGYPIDSKAADVNGDGKIGAADAMFIRQYIVGLITAFPAAEA